MTWTSWWMSSMTTLTCFILFTLDDEREYDRRCFDFDLLFDFWRLRCSESESDSTGSNGCRWWRCRELPLWLWRDFFSCELDLKLMKVNWSYKALFFCAYLRAFSWRNDAIRSCSARVLNGWPDDILSEVECA
jgi:hypothetical protein